MYYINGYGWFDVHESARRHGVSDDDMCHAVAWAMTVLTVDEGYRGRAMHLGPDTAGRLLEVVTLRQSDGPTLIIHAMRMRPKFVNYFWGGEGRGD